MKRGFGTMLYPDGSHYSGEWRKDLMHGHGLYTYTNGDTYDGSWFKGQRHGVGTYTYADETMRCTLHGTWVKGVRNGPVEIIFDKHRFHGTWLEEDPVGPSAYTFACKTMALGYVRMETDADATAAVEGSGSADDNAVVTGGMKVLRNMPGKPRTCEPAWKVQHIDRYDYSRLPPEPMPLPLGDSEDEECDVTPVLSEDEAIVFMNAGEEEEEGGLEEEGDEEEIELKE